MDNVSLIDFKDFNRILKEGMTLVGGPFSKARLWTKLSRLTLTTLEGQVSCLALLHTKDILLLLKNSLATCVINFENFWLPQHSLFVKFDNIFRAGLSPILNVDLDDSQWLQATLPVKNIGIGIRSVTMLAPSAFF